jgi:anaerobic selenocysteine-containing dehydrogenase
MKCRPALQNGTVATLCRMCDTRCAINVQLKEGVIVDITPFDRHPVNLGRMCPRGGAAVDMFYHRDRILKPLKKQSDGSFAEISPETALDEIAARIAAVRDAHGARAVGVWKGEGVGFFQQEEYARRFARALGTPNYLSNDSACFVGRYLGYHLVNGFWNSFPEFSDARLILLFGTNPPMCHPPFMREFADAREKGAKLVVIDPRLNPIACYADIFAQPYPGTDGALIWGLINHLIENRTYDIDLVERHVAGFEKIAAYARTFTPAFVEAHSGIYSRVVADIAQLIVNNRPNISIFPGAGLEHHENGVNAARALAILTCLAGAIGVNCGLFHPEPMGGRTLTLDDDVSPDGEKAVGGATYPVFYDLRREGHSMTAMDHMLGNGDYPIKALIVTAANPAVTNPNTAKVEQALGSLDLLVVNDFFMTRTARLAHYILPAATFLEREEIHYYAKRQMVNLSRRVITVEGVRDEYTLWHDLAHRLGFGETRFPWPDEDAVNRWILEPTGFTVEQLRRHPEGLVYKPVDYGRCRRRPFPTPSGKIEFASARLKALGLPEIPEYVAPYHRGPVKARYPFVLTTGARKSLFYHSRHQNIPRFRTVHPHPEMEIHPEDAARLGIRDQDRVRVVSEVGSLEIRAKVVHPSELQPGVVEIYHGWEDCPVNVLTPDAVNDPISGFPLLKAVPVRIEKIIDTESCRGQCRPGGETRRSCGGSGWRR